MSGAGPLPEQLERYVQLAVPEHMVTPLLSTIDEERIALAMKKHQTAEEQRQLAGWASMAEGLAAAAKHLEEKR